MMPVNGLDLLHGYDAILLGAVGDPEIPDAETLWGLLIPIRRTFEQYVICARPVPSPAFPRSSVPNSRSTSSSSARTAKASTPRWGGRFGRGLSGELTIQESIFTRTRVTRVGAYAVELAARRRRHLTSATKSNGIVHTMPFGDEVIDDVADHAPTWS